MIDLDIEESPTTNRTMQIIASPLPLYKIPLPHPQNLHLSRNRANASFHFLMMMNIYMAVMMMVTKGSKINKQLSTNKGMHFIQQAVKTGNKWGPSA